MLGTDLLDVIRELAEKAKLDAIGTAVYDCATGLYFSYEGERMFHAASTMKAGVLFAVLKLVEEGEFELSDRVHVRNRFISVADGRPFRVNASRDADSEVPRRLGRTMSLEDLCRAMIARSSNLATNLLVDLIDADRIDGIVRAADVPGIAIRRGVEDDAAFEAGICNEASADGLAALMKRFLESGHLGDDVREKGLEILHTQEFKKMIPAALPDTVAVAHKTGEISTVSHDAGIVFPADRPPYVVAILTEGGGGSAARTEAVAALSKEIFARLTQGDHS